MEFNSAFKGLIHGLELSFDVMELSNEWGLPTLPF